MTHPVQLAALSLEHPVMNAAGTCKTLADTRRFARSAVSAVTVGSVTCEALLGNSGDVYWRGDGFSLNALGLPNPGLAYYREHLPEMAAEVTRTGKRLVVSVAGFSPADYAELAAACTQGGANVVELNLGCPNVWLDGRQKPIVSYSPQLVSDVLATVRAALPSPAVLLAAKLSPIPDPGLLAEVAAAIGNQVNHVIACNTWPNAYVRREGRAVIGVGYAGLSGAALRPVAVGQVHQLRQLLPHTVGLVGAGGVRRPADVTQFLGAGADAVQAATVFWDAAENPGVFGDLLA